MVGATTQKNKLVNGQSMMFQLFVDCLQERGVKTIVVDFGRSVDPNFSSKRVSGKFGFTKLIDNFLLIFRFIFVLLVHYKTDVYITTSQSKVGFIRDFMFINLASFFGNRVVAHQFGANYHQFYKTQQEGLKNKIATTLAKTDKIIVEGAYTKEQFSFLKDYQEKVVTITNGLPQKVNSTAIAAKHLKPGEPIQLLYLSNLIESKGYIDVLESVNLLINRDHQNINVVFAGKFLRDADDRIFTSNKEAEASFLKYIKENNLEKNVSYFNGLCGEAKAEAFRKAHFFLLPSFYINEGQPVSVLESLAYGCVPIVTQYRLIPDMVKPNNGFFVPPQNPGAIAAVINNLIKNPEKYAQFSAAGIEAYKRNFTAEKYIDKLLKYF